MCETSPLRTLSRSGKIAQQLLSARSRTVSLVVGGGGGDVGIFSSVQVTSQPNTSRPHLHHPAHQVPFSISEETSAEFCVLLHSFHRSTPRGFKIPPTPSTSGLFFSSILSRPRIVRPLLPSSSSFLCPWWLVCILFPSLSYPRVCSLYFFRVQLRIPRVTMQGSYLPLLPGVVSSDLFFIQK